MRDEPGASPRRHVGRGVVALAVGRFDNWIAAEMKIRILGVPVRPVAGARAERENFLGEGDCLYRRRFDEGSRQLRFGAAICPGGDRDGDLLDLVNRRHPCDQQANHDADGGRDTAIAGSPPPDVSWADAK